MNHDALFKMLLKSPVVLRGFFEAFVPDAAPFIDFGLLEFIDKERFTLDGRKRTGDLLVRTRFRGKPAGFLIHLEHQAQPDPDLGRRMLEYFLLDWREYDLPVYPIAVLSHKATCRENVVPVTVDFPHRRVLEFTFDLIRLAALPAGNYVTMPNPAALALAARMKSDPRQRVALTRDLLVTLTRLRLRRKERGLVFGFFAAYHPLDEAETLQLEDEVAKLMPDMAREKVIELTNPFIELGVRRGRRQGLREGRREGLEKGRHKGEAELVLRQLTRRLGPLSRSRQAAVRKLSISEIEALDEALFDFGSPRDLARWLRENSRAAE